MKKFLLSLLGVITCICAQATDYKLVTSASDLKVGAKYIIVAKYTNNSTTTWYAMGAQNSNVRSTIVINAPSNEIVSITTEVVTPITLCNSNADSYEYNLQTGTNLYLYNSSTNNYLKEANLSADGVGDTANASISISAESVATITFNKSKKDSDFNATIFFNYNNGSPRFSCYFKKGQQPVYLYKEVTTSGGGGEDLKDCGLAYDRESVSLVEGEALTQPKLNNPNTLTVTYSSDNEDVATVDAKGTISLAGGLGTAVITASTEGDDTHKAGSATFTITVKKAQVAYLVTDVTTLQPGDIVIIANKEYGKAMSTENNTNNRKTTDVTFNKDFSEITSIPDEALLLELEQSDTYWSFKTTNYVGTNGFLTTSESTTSDKNYLKITTTESDYTLATITITDGVATIQLNKGTEPSAPTEGDQNQNQNRNLIQFNPNTANNNPIFACYGSASQQPVYIYKLVDKPATITEDAPSFEFKAKADDENLNVIVLDNTFITTTTANKVAIYMENVLVGIYNVDEDGYVDANFDYVPYLPNAEFTMRPVIKTDAKGNPTQLGPSEDLSFTWPNLDSSDTFGYDLYDQAIFCVNEDSQVAPWILYGQFTFIDVFKKPNLDYYVSVEAVKKDDRSFVYEDAQFAWGNGGFIVDIPNYFTSNKWDDSTSHPDITGCTVPKVTFIITPSYEFTYDTKYSSLVTSASAAPARLTVPGTTATQTIVSAKQELTSTLTNSNTVSGVEGVTVDANAPVEFFNLQGVRVDGALAPGIYIRRQGRSVSKVQIR